MKLFLLRIVCFVILISSSVAVAASVVVAKGTPVDLKFQQALSSKTAKEGQSVNLTVASAVRVNGVTVLKAGTRVTGVISKVHNRGRWGKNATLRIAVNPVTSVYGVKIPLDPRTSGKTLHGKKSDQAAAATIGGAVVLGPVGLAGGYFTKGKSVEIKPGDFLPTEVSRTITVKP